MEQRVRVSICEDVSLITFNNVPAHIGFISFMFRSIAQQQINVDMISQSAPVGGHINISFTVNDEDIGKILMLMPTFREYSADIKPIVSSGNTKMSIFGEFMRDQFGVASKIFDAAEAIDAEIKLITTSEVDVSLLIPKNIEKDLEQAIIEKVKVD